MSIYFPIFRGKQYELIAIREFAESRSQGSVIHPVIEPVRDPTENTGLARMIAALESSRFEYTIIVNPSKGDLAQTSTASEVIVRQLEIAGATPDRLAFGILFHAGGADRALEAISRSTLQEATTNLIYDYPVAGPRDVGELKNHAVQYHLVEDKNVVRTLQIFHGPSCVRVSRAFKRAPRNTDYVGAPPSIFCSDHLYFEEDGFDGFADYLTIGDDYSEGGGMPLALVIHLTYQDPEDRLIYIRHFCSVSNDDQSDPGGKFLEAVASLVDFIDDNELSNPALEAFRTYNREQRYPGLGTIKKLSMQNHLYVMDLALA